MTSKGHALTYASQDLFVGSFEKNTVYYKQVWLLCVNLWIYILVDITWCDAE